MNIRIVERIRQELWTADLNSTSSAELALLIVGWAKLSVDEKIPLPLRLSSELISDPKELESAVVKLGGLGGAQWRVFSEAARLIEGKAGGMLPALHTALELMKAGFEAKLDAVLLPALPVLLQVSGSLGPAIARLLIDVARIAPEGSVYVPWDGVGQLAASAAAAGARPSVETPSRSLIPGSVALCCETPFEVRFSDPIRAPSFVEKGKPVKFDRAVCFPPMNTRYEVSVAQKDWFDRFPESTGVGSVLAIRHLLWQTKKRVVVAVTNNLLFSTGVEQELREDLLSQGIIEAVIAMRGGLLPDTNIPFSILVLDPRGGHEEIRFVRGDADRFVEPESKAKFRLKDIRELVEVINGDLQTAETRIIPVGEIGPGAQLQPNRYVLPESTKRLLDVVSAARTVSLGELVRTIRPMNTKAGKGTPIEVYEIGAADLPAYGYIREPGRTVQLDSLVSATNEDQFLRANDIVLIVKGSVGKVAIVPEDAPGPGPGGWIAGQSAIVLRVKENARVDAKAIALQLRSEVGQSLLKNIVSGATIPLIQLRELMAMPILLPSMEEQRRAAQVLEEEARIQRQIDELRERQSKIAAGLWTLEPEKQEVFERLAAESAT